MYINKELAHAYKQKHTQTKKHMQINKQHMQTNTHATKQTCKQTNTYIHTHM